MMAIMGPELLAYPFLFIALFFEMFVLVTFLSEPARRARNRAPAGSLPAAAIIIPCYNEKATFAATAESALALDYPADKLSVILVDDGSTDGTAELMARFENNPRVTVIRKENGGKHTALNAGIAATRAELVGCLDADSFVESSALLEMVPCFDNPKVGASTAAMSVNNPKGMIEHMQNAEYIFGITLRHALSSVNGLYVTPGPFSFYRREIVEALGGFRAGHSTEDLEMALRLQRAGYIIENAPRARVYTNAPKSVGKLVKQRTRWTTGFLRNVLYDYRDLIGNRNYGALGLFVLPIGLTAIASGMLLFGVTLFLTVRRAVEMVMIHEGIPYTFSLPHHVPSFDWYYVPASLYVLMALSTIVISLSMIVLGKTMSKTPGSLRSGLISYVFLYGFIAPLWLVRATADVVTGAKRSWR
jgi:cellulose synthase/poly-beta-1,6-N-acetylglucosamine synthase-like glycosyltransferase